MTEDHRGDDSTPPVSDRSPRTPASPPEPAATVVAPDPVTRRRWRLLSGLRAGASRVTHSVAEPVRPDEPVRTPPPIPEPTVPNMLERSPFSFGFTATLGALIAYVLMKSLSSVSDILLMVGVSLFLAMGLNPIVELLQRRHFGRGLAVTVVALGGIGVVFLGVWAIFPILRDQATSLIESAPSLLRTLRSNEWIAEIDTRFDLIGRLTSFLTSGSLINALFGGIVGAGMFVVNTVISVVVTFVLTVYFLASLDQIKQLIYQLSPGSRRDRNRYLADETFRRVGGYLTGMFIVVSIASGLAFIFMLIVGMGQFAVALAFVVAMFAFIPLIGTFMSLSVVSLIGFTISPGIGIACIIYFIVYAEVEAYIIQPRVMSRQVNVPGAVVVVAALVGGSLLGIIGALVAIPTAAVIILLYHELLVPRLDAM